MNKLIQAHLFIYLVCSLHYVSVAQTNNNRPVEFKPVPLFNTNTPDDQVQVNSNNDNPGIIKSTAPTIEKKKNVELIQATTPSKSSPNPNDNIYKTNRTSPESFKIDKNNNSGSATDKAVDKDQLREEEISSGIEVDNNVSSKNIITYPDLQVIATQETIAPSQNIGTERQPNVVVGTKKTSPPEPQAEIKNTPLKSTKADFLRQYVQDLKNEIERNKNNPDYPAAAKQQEIDDIENALKQ